MAIEIERYFGREFNMRSYNCWDFTRDVWKDLTGVDIGDREVPRTYRAMDEAIRLQLGEKSVTDLEEIQVPETPCIVHFSRPGSLAHIGVFLNGKVLHLSPRQNVVLDAFRVVASNFSQTRFYRCAG